MFLASCVFGIPRVWTYRRHVLPRLRFASDFVLLFSPLSCRASVFSSAHVQGTLRSIYVPESTRAGVMNFFRIPLNAFVVVVLLKVSSFLPRHPIDIPLLTFDQSKMQIKFMPVETVFFICAAAHVFAWVMFYLFTKAVANAPKPGVVA